MFEKASRLKLRFAYKGNCSVEDLWDLPLFALDLIFKNLNAEIKVAKEESLLTEKTREEEIVDLKIKIIRHIVETRLKEAVDIEAKREKANRKQKLLAILDKKQDNEIEEKSVEEIKKMLKELE